MIRRTKLYRTIKIVFCYENNAKIKWENPDFLAGNYYEMGNAHEKKKNKKNFHSKILFL